MVIVLRDWLLRLFGLSEIVAKQALEIDRLQMQVDLYYELAIIDANINIIRKLVKVDDNENN